MNSALVVVAIMVAEHPLGVDECVEIALKTSARVDEAKAQVAEIEARLAEVESIYYPKLSGLFFVAPMYSVRPVEGDFGRVERRWRRPGDWGPYAHLQAILAQPLYTFGRVEAAERAASERVHVERARLREAQNVVAIEVRRLYYHRLLALSLLPALAHAAEVVAEAEKKGQELYDRASGEVTQADLMRLRYGATEVAKYTRIAEDGAALALAALKHTMGLDDEAALALGEDRLPELAAEPPATLSLLLQQAAELRPEWAELEHGGKATLALEEAERLANAPTVVAGASLQANWTPTREHPGSPYYYDPYNGVVAGIGLGLQFDLDPAKAKARAQAAGAMHDRVEALRRFAATGIPLQVRKAREEVERARALVGLGTEAVRATRSWMTLAAAAYSTGTGEARDLLEGLVAYVQAKRGYYESLHDYHVACAELDFAVGRSGPPKT